MTVAEMAAEGMDLPRETFSALMRSGHHLLAPTASDLIKYNQLQTVFAGFHYGTLSLYFRSKFFNYSWKESLSRLICLVAVRGTRIRCCSRRTLTLISW